MRLFLFFFLALAGSLLAGEGPEKPAYPLWDGQEPVAEYAQRVNLPPTQTLDLGHGVKLELVLIPAGQFIMGTPEPAPPQETVAVGQTILGLGGAVALGLLLVVLFRAIKKRQRPHFSLRWLLLFVFALSIGLYGGVRWWKTAQAWREYAAEKARSDLENLVEKPAHPITLTQPFYMGKFVVTQEQYQTISGSNPSHFKARDNPVEMVSWDEAQAFCKKLAEQARQAVRLPTEAEWEYSCRAGTTTTYHSGDAEAGLARVAWYYANSNDTIHPVGQKEPNALGLYDMHGNVDQWCQDWYEDDYYSNSAAEDPQGPTEGFNRALRGGSWHGNPWICRSAYRGCLNPVIRRFFTVGFRVVVPASRTP